VTTWALGSCIKTIIAKEILVVVQNLSVDGIIVRFRGKNGLSHNIYFPLFEGHLMKILRIFLCSYFYVQAAWAFLADSSVVGLGSQRVNDITCCNDVSWTLD
jgi:hypothetical protein